MRFIAKGPGLLAAWTLSVWLTACGGGGAESPPPVTAPGISAQPQALGVDDGSSATFTVVATGSGTLTYQWMRNDQPIAGAVAASYTTPPLNLGDSGASYRVTVSNAAGSTSSNPVPVTVRAVAPSLQSQPQSASVGDGESVAFGVNATGSKPLVYTWLRNGIEIKDAHEAALKLDTAVLGDNGTSFVVKVSNGAGAVTSQAATLTVRPIALELTRSPVAQTVSDGAVASFNAMAKGSGTISYQWLLNGQPIAGATSSSYSLSTAYADNGKRFSVRVSNGYGTLTSDAVLLTVDALAPTPSQELKLTELVVDQSATFSVSSGGTPPLRYQWERSDDAGGTWRAIDGATGIQYGLASATLAWADTRLRVKVSNVAGTVASAPVIVKVRPQVRILAGGAGGMGYHDGKGAQSRFASQAQSMVRDAQGNILVPDTMNGLIRKVAPDGTVSTYAGKPGAPYDTDGPLNQATFGWPMALAGDGKGNVYVASLSTIRRIGPDGQVSRIAGGNCCGHVDGDVSKSSFSGLTSFTVAADGTGYAVDVGSRTLRKIGSDGLVSTLAGKPGAALEVVDGLAGDARFGYMGGVAVDATGNVYVGDSAAIRMVTPDGRVSRWAGNYDSYGDTDGHRLGARFLTINQLSFDDQGRLHVLQGDGKMRRIDVDGQVTTLAGARSNSCVQKDGTGAEARLCNPVGLSWDSRGYFLTIDQMSVLRRINPDASVDTIAGAPPREWVTALGQGTAARFFSLNHLHRDAGGELWVTNGDVVDPVLRVDARMQVSSAGLGWTMPSVYARASVRSADGTFYVLDSSNNQVFKVRPGGKPELLAGKVNYTEFGKDGQGAEAIFNGLSDLVLDAKGNLYVAETGSHLIRRIDPAGKVTTISGQTGHCGHRDGPGATALHCMPRSLALDAQGNLLVSDQSSHTVRRISPDGEVTTLAGTPFYPGLGNGYSARFDQPGALALDSQGNVYVADGVNALIRRITPNGYVTTVLGTGQRILIPGLGGSINEPKGLVMLPGDRLLIATEGALVGD